MTDNLLLLKDRHVILRVLAGLVAVCATTRLIDEVFSSFEVFLVACHLI